MLQHHRFFDSFTVDLHRELGRVLIVGDQSRLFIVAVIVKATLLVCDTNALERDHGRELSIFLSNVVVTLVKSVLDHSRHAWILVDVAQLWGGLKTCL